MNRRLIPVVAVSTLALTASGALAASTEPAGGSWKSKKGEGDEAVSFTVQRSTSGVQKASALKAVVPAPCEAPDPNDSTAARLIKTSGVTVNLKVSGGKLKGSKTVKKSVDKGKAIQTVKIAITFTSDKKAKVDLKGSYVTGKSGKQSNADRCSGKVSLTATPKK